MRSFVYTHIDIQWLNLNMFHTHPNNLIPVFYQNHILLNK